MGQSILSFYLSFFYNVTTNDMNEGKMEYAKFGKVGLNNRVSLLHRNI